MEPSVWYSPLRREGQRRKNDYIFQGVTVKNQSAVKGLDKVPAIFLVAAAVFYILLFCAVFLLRFGHPFELSWLEALVFEHVQRVRAGLPLFVEPTFGFVPLIYTPLYYYLCAALAPVSGGLPALRAVSFGCTIGSMLLITLLVRRETNSIFSGVLATGLFAATYKLSGFWMDLARIDSMMLFFFLAGLYSARSSRKGSSVLAGLLFGAAFLTKQSALFGIAPALVAVFWHRRSAGLTQAGTALAIAAVASLVWNISSHGWYRFYAFTLPSHHEIAPGLILHFATDIFLLPICVALLFGVWYFLAPPSKASVEAKWIYALITLGAMSGGALSLAKWGGYLNAMLMPHALVSILFGLGFQSALESLRSLPESLRPRVKILTQLAALIQFVALIYNPMQAIPSAQEARTAWSLVSKVRDLPGEVFIPDQPYLLSMAGKPTHAHEMQLADILAHGDTDQRDRLLNQTSEAARKHRFAAVVGHPDQPVLENPFSYWPEFSKHYVEQPGVILPSELLLRMDASKFMQNRLYLPHSQNH